MQDAGLQPTTTAAERADALRPLLAQPPAAAAPGGARPLPVLVFPRQGAGPESTAVLRAALQQAGLRPRDWGLGTDTGPRGMALEHWLRKLEDVLLDAYEAEQQPLVLLGWGLSGIYARELAKRARPLVRQVVTLGTPLNTAADPHRRCPVLALLDAPAALPWAARQRLRLDPPVPCTAIYSRDDGLLRLDQCVAPQGSGTEQVELHGVRHEALGSDPRVLEIVAQRLAPAMARPAAAAGALA